MLYHQFINLSRSCDLNHQNSLHVSEFFFIVSLSFTLILALFISSRIPFFKPSFPESNFEPATADDRMFSQIRSDIANQRGCRFSGQKLDAIDTFLETMQQEFNRGLNAYLRTPMKGYNVRDGKTRFVDGMAESAVSFMDDYLSTLQWIRVWAFTEQVLFKLAVALEARIDTRRMHEQEELLKNDL